MKLRRVVRTAVLGLAVLATVGLAPNASAKADKCRILDHSRNAMNKSLQAAVDAAEAGATLDVRGTCRGTTTISKNLTINGEQVDGFTDPILDGNRRGSVLTIDAGVTVVLKSLTITAGIGLHGGGIYNAGELTIERSDITNNSASQGGGGIYNLPLAKIALTDSRVTGNSAFSAGGIDANGDVTLTNSAVTSNVAIGGPGGGIGISSGAKTTLIDSTVSGNSASNGGGLAMTNAQLTQVNGSVISGNTASASGGGIYVYGIPTSVTLTDSAVSGNAAAGAGAGGIQIATGSVTLTRTSVTGNTGTVGGVWTSSRAEVLALAESAVTGNIGTVDAGGISIACTTVTATTSTISGNTGGTGGGISIFSAAGCGLGAVTLNDSAVGGNTAVQGGGVYFSSFGDGYNGLLTLNDSAVTDNTASTDGGGIYGCGTVEANGTSAISDNDPNDLAGCPP
jgi:hypothetical protein